MFRCNYMSYQGSEKMTFHILLFNPVWRKSFLVILQQVFACKDFLRYFWCFKQNNSGVKCPLKPLKPKESQWTRETKEAFIL